VYVVCASQQASKFFVNMTSLQKTKITHNFMFRAKHGPVDRFRDDCDDHGAFPSTAAGWWGEVETAKPGGGFRPTPPGHRVGD